MDLFPSVLSDLMVGILAAGTVATLGFLFRTVGALQRGQPIVDKLRLLGWPFFASVFIAVSLTSAILRGGTMSVVVLGALLVLPASLTLLRLGPERLLRFVPGRIRPLATRVRAYSWRILTGIFFLSSVILLLLNLQTSSPSPSDERIVFVVDLADEEIMVMRDILDELEPEVGAEVFLMNVDCSRFVARLSKMVASGDMKWDLIAADNNMVGILAAKGLVEDLSQYRQRDEIIPQSLLPSLRPLLSYKGKFYFAPFRPNVKIAFYNEHKFARYGLEPPRNWDQLLEVARVFKEKEGVGRVAIQGDPGKATAVTVFEFVMAAGGDPVSLDDDGARRAFTFLQQLEPYLAREYTETSFDTANELLIDDQVYLVSNWTYGIKVVVEDAGKRQIKAYPGWNGPERQVHVLGGDVLAVPKDAPHPDRAIKLIEALLSKETQQKLVSHLRWPPVRLDAYETTPPELATYFDAVDEALSSAVPRPPTPQWTMVEKELDRAFEGLIRERGDIASLEEYSASLRDIPSDYVRYQVKPGDTLEEIARRYDTTLAVLAEANGITTRTSIGPGQVLLVPRR